MGIHFLGCSLPTVHFLLTLFALTATTTTTAFAALSAGCFLSVLLVGGNGLAGF
jgi:hypothetical protein